MLSRLWQPLHKALALIQGEIYYSYRHGGRERHCFQGAWRALGPFRLQVAELLKVEDPMVLDDCDECDGRGTASKGAPCPVCAGTGVEIFRPAAPIKAAGAGCPAAADEHLANPAEEDEAVE